MTDYEQFCSAFDGGGLHAALQALGPRADLVELARVCFADAQNAEDGGDYAKAAHLQSAAVQLRSVVEYRAYLELPYHLD